jgi:Short C-terminal domain/Phospholipase_D-nuclease N-terminal
MIAEWTFGTFLWGTVVFFFWVMLIWMFIAIFGDILRRRDLSGWGKAGWCILVFGLPFIGILAYLIVRPKGELDPYRGEVWDGQTKASSADEIAKAAQLKQSGAITAEEYDRLKQRALA